MAKFNPQKINVWFDRFDEQFRHAPNIIAETAVEYYKERLIQKNWAGVPYAPYKNKKREPSRGSLMMRNNNLFASIRPSEITPDRVTVSAGSPRVPYARIHNFGGRVRGIAYVRPHHNKHFMGKGERYGVRTRKGKTTSSGTKTQIRGHSRKIDFMMPRRQFMGPSQNLSNLIRERLVTIFKK